MKEILTKYCSDEVGQTGLFLFNPPTGSGKTYRVLEYIYTNYKEICKGGRKIFFVTNLKKNLPYNELKTKFFESDGKLAAFEKDVLFIDSNQDCVINNLLKVEDQIGEYFQTKDFKQLIRSVRALGKIDGNPNMSEVIEDLKQKIREQYEPRFRKYITKYLSKEYASRQERIQAIRTEENLKWIGKLYPTVFTHQKKIFFLSIDKFITKNSTLVEPSYYFHEDKISKDSLVFIDEFDSSKSSILNSIIEKGLSQDIDYIKFFNSIHNALLNNVFPEGILRISQDLEEQRKNNSHFLTPNQHIDLFREKADKLSEEFNLKLSYKAVGHEMGKERNLLFHDFRYHSIFQDNKRYVQVLKDSKEKINKIRFVDDLPAEDKKSIISLLYSLKGYINYFKKGISHLAQNYRSLKIESGYGIDFTIEFALNSILEEFALDHKFKNFIIDSILSDRKLAYSSNHSLHHDLSVYQNGFRYYDFLDSEEHDTITKTILYSFQNSPEKFLLKLSERAKVVGISATALIDSVVGNYDLNYLSNQLGANFYRLSEEEIQGLRSDFESTFPDYEKRLKIHPYWFEVKDSKPKDLWYELFQDQDLALDIFNRVPENDFLQTRYFKVAKAYKEYVSKDEINSLLCMMNTLPKKGKASFDEELLYHIFYILQRTFGTEKFKFDTRSIDISQTCIILQSNGYRDDKRNLKQRLESGNKVFVLSTYQTLGAGQNLQFRAPSPEELVRFVPTGRIDWNTDNKTDINAIYLDKPTHLLVNVNNAELKESDFAKYLFQLEFLQEHGDISMRDLNHEVKFAFKNLTGSKHGKERFMREGKIESLYAKSSFSLLLAKIVIQAIGRLCRTNLKSKNVFIFADSEIYPHIQRIDEEKEILLPEFQALKNAVPQAPKKLAAKEMQIQYINRAVTTSKKTELHIKALMNGHWTADRMKQWKELRELTMKYPSLSAEEAQTNPYVNQLFVRLPLEASSYSYNQQGDYHDIDISFNGELPFEVSESECRLEELMRIPGLKSHFQKQGWATSISSGILFPSPMLFNNIYKGALGEEAGKHILESCGIQLLPIEDSNEFEKFDFKTEGGVYYDFKHWHRGFQLPAEPELDKISAKLEAVKGAKAIIVNVLGVAEVPIKTNDNGIIEVPYLFNPKTLSYNEVALKYLVELDTNE